MLEKIQKQLDFWQFTRSQQKSFLEDICELVEDGVPVQTAVKTVGELASGVENNVANAILHQIAKGKSLAEGMEGWFPSAIIEIVRAGEKGGTLAENMRAAANALTQQTHAAADFLSAMTYPIAVLVAGMAVSVYMKNSIFTNFAGIRPIEQWPESGRLLYNFASFIESGWWFLLLALIAIIVTLLRAFRHFSGESRKYFDKIPLLSLYSDVMSARFMETLGLLLVNGMILKQALEVLRQSASPYLLWHIDMMAYRLSGGRDNIAEVLDTGLIARDHILRLKVIAKGKGFEAALVRLGQLSAARNTKKIKLTAKIMGGVLLALGAAQLGFMVMAIYSVGSFLGT